MIRTSQPAYRLADFDRELAEHYAALCRFCGALTGDRDTGLDLAHDTVLKVRESWQSYQPGTRMKAWLFVCARNRFYGEKRRSWRQSTLEQRYVENIADTAKTQAEGEELLQDFCTYVPLLSLVPVEQRDAVVAVRFAELTYEEAAHCVGIITGTMKSRVSRGAARLRELASLPDPPVLDISAWARMTEGLSKRDPFYPIARAYEEIYLIARALPQFSHAARRLVA